MSPLTLSEFYASWLDFCATIAEFSDHREVTSDQMINRPLHDKYNPLGVLEVSLKLTQPHNDF